MLNDGQGAPKCSPCQILRLPVHNHQHDPHILDAGQSHGRRILVTSSQALACPIDSSVIGATALLESFMGLPDTPENREKFIATIPMGRMSEPQDIANACLYLASDEAEFITGIVLEVDGGRTI